MAKTNSKAATQKPASKATGKSAGKTTEKTTAKASGKSASKPVTKTTVTKTTAKSTTKTSAKAASKSTAKSTSKMSDIKARALAGLAKNKTASTAKRAPKKAPKNNKKIPRKPAKRPTPSLLLKAPKAAAPKPSAEFLAPLSEKAADRTIDKTIDRTIDKTNNRTVEKTVEKATDKSSASQSTAQAAPVAPKPAAPKPKSEGLDLEFIGRFPLRKGNSDKKLDNKKSSAGPVFEPGDYKVATFKTPLCKTYYDEFKMTYLGRHSQDTADVEYVPFISSSETIQASMSSLQRIIDGTLDMFLLNMKDIPLDLPAGLTIGASFKREDPRDVLVTRSTYGAVQELPHQAKIAANSKRRVMQIRALRPDLQIVPSAGNVSERLVLIDTGDVDALVLSWSSLRRLNLSPRYYVSLQAELMVPAPCQGTVGVICRESDESLLAKLRYVEDSEASWSSRCERAFVAKMGGKPGAPIGALAHRKGTQDPWILDIAVGDPASGEILKHREIGTSRCKPESLADKAFAGILGKGARRFMFL